MWRGVNATGIVAEKDLPVSWSQTENVKWRVTLPEPGNSTPVIWGNRIFLTQPKQAEGLRLLMCFDRATGKLLWQSDVKAEAGEPTHKTNYYASASPATDGKMVVAWFGSVGLIAYDMNGKQLWRRDLGRQRHAWGYAASPLIAGGRVFLNFGPGDRAFLVALDQVTGKSLWQVDVPAGKGVKFGSWSAEDMYGSWSTPVMAGSDLVVSHPRRLVAYDPVTGKEKWSSDVLGDLIYPSPLFGEGVLVAASGFGGPIAAVKPGGGVLWRQEKWKSQIGTGVITGGHMYVVDNGGIAHCVKLATGEMVWSNRLMSDGEDNGVWASPVLIDGKILVTNKSGRTFVFAAKPVFELYGTNNVAEATNSSLAAASGDIVLRTHEALWCFTRKSN